MNNIRETGHHPKVESSSAYSCQKLIRAWIENRGWPSTNIILSLHNELFSQSDYSKNGLKPAQAGSFRDGRASISGKPENFLCSEMDVPYLMNKYGEVLDNLLEELPSSPYGNVQSIIELVSWSYYVFERIHPFFDGNGRIGRMIIKRILKGAGLKDLVLHDERWNGKNRSSHLETMDKIDGTGNLDILDLYFLKELRHRYSNGETLDNDLLVEINKVIELKEAAVKAQKQRIPLEGIWPEFAERGMTGSSR